MTLQPFYRFVEKCGAEAPLFVAGKYKECGELPFVTKSERETHYITIDIDTPSSSFSRLEHPFN